MYDLASRKILKWADDAAAMSQSKENNQNVVYVDNIFMELNDIYLTRQQTFSNSEYDEHDQHDDLVLGAIKVFLQGFIEALDAHEKRSNLSHLPDYHFSFLVPSNWDYGIRDGLIRPLFIGAGLITENDHKSRLLFFTRLESNFRYIQDTMPDNLCTLDTKTIRNGNQFILYELYFTENNLFVYLDLFSAHYPPTLFWLNYMKVTYN